MSVAWRNKDRRGAPSLKDKTTLQHTSNGNVPATVRGAQGAGS
jgi:hypothetical protein